MPDFDWLSKVLTRFDKPDRFAAYAIGCICLIAFGSEQLDIVSKTDAMVAAIIAVVLVTCFWLLLRTMSSSRGHGTSTSESKQPEPGKQPEPSVTNLELISRGILTETWKGFDPTLRRSVVKKVLHDPKGREEFTDGIRSAVKLADLPGYVTIYSADFDSDAPYVLMQYLGNGNLRSHIEAQEPTSINIEFVRRMVFKVGETIRIAHDRGVKLGHIKPSNILLDEAEEPHVSLRTRLTFSNPAQVQAALRDHNVTLEDLVYIAPELFSHEHPEVRTELCDQYALGILAYELLTCKLPRTLPTVHGDLSERIRIEQTCALLRRNGLDAFVRLPPVHEVQPKVPTQISEILAKMTALDSSKRFDRLDQAIDALRSAAQSVLMTARDSYIRCLENERTPTFLECFYELFIADKVVGGRFEKFDKARWSEQHGRLQAAIDASFDFAKLLIRNVGVPEPNAMTQLVDLHGPNHLNIAPAEYAIFVEALIATVCGDGERPPYDPYCKDAESTEFIARAWRGLMVPIIDHFLVARATGNRNAFKSAKIHTSHSRPSAELGAPAAAP